MLSLNLIEDALRDTSKIDRRALDELHALYVEFSERSYQDVVVAALVNSYRMTGEDNYGQKLLAEYLTRFRRELTPVPSYLVRMQSSAEHVAS